MQIRIVFLAAMLGLLVATGLSWWSLEELVLENSWDQMRNVALVAARTWEAQDRPDLPQDPLLTAHLTVADASGQVIADTYRDPEDAPNNIRGKPEFEAAIRGTEGRDTRLNRYQQRETLMLAVPLHKGGRIVGVMRTAMPVAEVRQKMAELQMRLLGFFIVAMLVAGALAELVTRSFLRPLSRIGAALRSESGPPYPEEGPVEIQELTHALNVKAEEVRTQYATLASQHDRLERILDRLEDGILVVDPAGEVVYGNPAVLTICGVTRERLVERDLGEVSDVAGRTLQLARTAGDHSDQIDVDETDQHIVVDTLEIAWGRGDLKARVAVLRDITRFVRLDRMRQEFVANASHELRTPITAVATSLEALEMGALDDRTHRDAFLARARRAVTRLMRLANDLLDLSVAEGVPQDDGSARCDAADVAIQVITTATAVASSRGQALSADVPELPVLVPIREGDLSRVLGNMVDNSMKYTPSGGTIEVAVQVSDTQVVLTVDDNGPGIPPAIREAIFERFFRAEKSRSEGGAGLGLTIARHLVQRCGGRVEADTSPLGGARIRTTMPLAPERRVTTEKRDARARESGLSSFAQGS